MTDKNSYIKRIQDLHLKKTGVVLPDAVAADYLEKLVALVSVVYQPIPTAEYAN